MISRGFTLYTALLSFILILLAALLVNTMINAERISNEVVLEVEAQSRMQSFADLTRADALQVVNYGIRNAIEEYTQNTGNAYPYSSNTTNWEQVQDDFSNFFFGGNGGGVLAGRIAANLSVIVSSNQRQIGGYSITIEGGNESQLKAAIQDVLKDTIAGGSEFLEVVDCDIAKAPVDCVGTFYVNLDFSTIDDATYESLPSIHVKDATTGRELVEPVIPRGKFRIYVPLRIFRALRYAHDIAGGSLSGGAGLLDPTFHANLGKLGVGMCDHEVSPGVSNCGYRTHPFTEANPAKLGPGTIGANGGFLCPAEQAGISTIENAYPKNVPLMCDPTASSLGLCSGTGPVLNASGNPVTYNPSDAVSRATALGALVKGIINNSVTVTLNPTTTPDFELLTSSLLIEPKVTSFESKAIQYEGLNAAATAAHCTKLVETNVVLTFEETNLNYIVVDSRAPLLYDVRIVDTFIASGASSGVCVSYCIQPGISFTDVVFGPTLSTDAAACPQTACAPPNTYQKELCGNGVLDTGEECDKLSTPTIACELVPPAGQYLSGNDATCNGSCQIVPAACVKANECGNNVKEGTEQCDGTDTAACPVPNSTCVGKGPPTQCTCVAPPAP
jgi:hypothetical protein